MKYKAFMITTSIVTLVFLLGLAFYYAIERPAMIRTDPVKEDVKGKVLKLIRENIPAPNKVSIGYLIKEPAFEVKFDIYYFHLTELWYLKPIRPYIESKVNYQVGYDFKESILIALAEKRLIEYKIISEEYPHTERYALPKHKFIEVVINSDKNFHEEFRKVMSKYVSLKSDWSH